MSSIRRIKDRSQLLATMVLRADKAVDRDCKHSGYGGTPDRSYFRVYLWKNLEALKEVAADGYPSGGFVAHAPIVWNLFDDGSEEFVYRPLLGEIHLAKSQWNEAIVAHELLHALFGSIEQHAHAGRLPDDIIEILFARKAVDGNFAHELIAHRFGRWFSEVIGWLWSVDHPRKYVSQ